MFYVNFKETSRSTTSVHKVNGGRDYSSSAKAVVVRLTLYQVAATSDSNSSSIAGRNKCTSRITAITKNTTNYTVTYLMSTTI